MYASGIYTLWWQQVTCTRTGHRFWLLLSAPNWSVLQVVNLQRALQTLGDTSLLLRHGFFGKLSESDWFGWGFSVGICDPAVKWDGTALTAGCHTPGPFRPRSWRRRATADWSSTNWAQVWSCRSFVWCNSSDLNIVTPKVTEQGHNLYERESRGSRIGWGITRECLYNPLLCNILHISQLPPSAAPHANWTTLKFSIWGQSREPAYWNIFWQSRHLLLLATRHNFYIIFHSTFKTWTCQSRD